MSAGRCSGTDCDHARASSKVIAVTSTKLCSTMSGVRALGHKCVPWHSEHMPSRRKRLTLAKRFSVSARLSSSVTVKRALRKVKSSSCTPFFVATVTCFFSSGPSSTICFSSARSLFHGTSVRTPNSRTISGWTLKPNICQGTIAPSSMVFDGCGMSAASSTLRTVPVPSHFGHAPEELNDSSSAPGGCTCSPQVGQ